MPQRFDFRVRFSGLCLFVPDTTQNQMHVLLPNTANHDHGAGRHEQHDRGDEGPVVAQVPAHLACLIFSRVHLGGNPNEFESRRIEGCSLEFDANVVGAAHVRLPSEIFNLSSIIEAGVDLTKNDNVISRVRLDSGRVTHRRGYGKWHLPGHRRQHLANHVRWTMQNVTGQQLIVRLRNLSDGSEKETLTLVPDTNDQITIFIGHMPEDEYEMDPCGEPPSPKDRCPDHILAYYSLFENPGAVVIPCLVERKWDLPTKVDPNDPDDDECEKSRASGARGRTFSCFTMGADASPPISPAQPAP